MACSGCCLDVCIQITSERVNDSGNSNDSRKVYDQLKWKFFCQEGYEAL